MKKNIQLLFLFVFLLNFSINAQDSTQRIINTNTIVNGYYQKVDLDASTSCKCDEKTQRTYDLVKGLRPNEVLNYSLHAYSFSFGNNTNVASKLFKAFENDPTVYKISMKEWTSFMMLTYSTFDVASFEEAAKQAFATFTPITTEEFLKIKNTTSYNEYMQSLEEAKAKQQAETPKN